MRVRTNSIFVADFGYIPPNIYDKIPTLNYKDFRITHPDFLRMDIHFVFSYPYKDFTMENIFHRWKKDIKRLNLLEKYYPIEYDGYFDILKSSHKLPFPIINNDNIAINGFAVYSLLLKFLESLDSKDYKYFKDFKEFKILDDSSLVFNSPIHSLDLITSIDVEDLLINVQLKKYRPFLDVSHEIYKSNTEEYDVSITCNKTELTSVSKIYLSNYEISKEETDSYILIANPHNLLLWFLINAFKTQNNLYKQFYGYTMKLLKNAEEYYEKKSNIDTFMKSPFSPSTFTIGKYNFRPHYSINLAKAIERTKDKTDEKFPEILINMSGKNYNPSTSESHPLISYEHPLYKHNGEEFTY
jgi:RNAse (barnase) inhibitor barstar